MYTWSRVIRFKNVGAMMAGMPICVGIADYMKKELKQDVSLLIPTLGGHPARVLFVVKSDDIGKNLEAMNKASQDGRYRDMVSKLGEHVDGSATNDQVWQTVV